MLQVLLTAPGGIVEQMPKDVGRLAGKIGSRFSGKGAPSEAGP